MSLSKKVTALGETLPPAAPPAASYLPWRLSGNTLYISGQLPFKEGALYATGKLGQEVSLEQGQDAAKQCALNILAQLQHACETQDLSYKGLLKISGFVNSTPTFSDQHLVLNGASEFLYAVLGDGGRHSRSAVGVANLPLNAAVEIEAIFDVISA